MKTAIIDDDGEKKVEVKGIMLGNLSTVISSHLSGLEAESRNILYWHALGESLDQIAEGLSVAKKEVERIINRSMAILKLPPALTEFRQKQLLKDSMELWNSRAIKNRGLGFEPLKHPSLLARSARLTYRPRDGVVVEAYAWSGVERVSSPRAPTPSAPRPPAARAQAPARPSVPVPLFTPKPVFVAPTQPRKELALVVPQEEPVLKAPVPELILEEPVPERSEPIPAPTPVLPEPPVLVEEVPVEAPASHVADVVQEPDPVVIPEPVPEPVLEHVQERVLESVAPMVQECPVLRRKPKEKAPAPQELGLLLGEFQERLTPFFVSGLPLRRYLAKLSETERRDLLRRVNDTRADLAELKKAMPRS